VCYALFKEFAVLCFDEEYASAVGWPTKRLDLLLTTLVVGVAVIGMQSVGLLLVVALLVIPPSAARFWSNRLGPMVLIASLIGGFSASTGVLLSASVQNLAAGPTIVLAGSLAFMVSLVFGMKRGAFWQAWQRYATRRKNGQVDLMRACFEEVEKQISPAGNLDSGLNQEVPDLTPYSISFESLKSARTWSSGRVSTLVRSALNEGLLRLDSDGNYRITQTGARFAARVVRNHRLWELYLIHFADIAPSRVDRDADLIEHVLEPGLIDQLEVLLKQSRIRKVPISPHS
jgi:manganese/zinc/iron transport system permease protein